MVYNIKSMLALLLGLCLLGTSCSEEKTTIAYNTETLKILKLSDQVYQHISYLETNDFGKVACNGMIAYNDGEVVIFDTPVSDPASEELINWVRKELSPTIKAVIPTHFHEDCVGGLEAFHKNNIPSYASDRTTELLKQNQGPIPKNSFTLRFQTTLGNEGVFVDYLGEGHTQDNLVVYFPSARTMFGGCMIKSDGAGKGYLGDADVDEWPLTVTKVKEKFPDVTVVIPGHGKAGGRELLDYTIKLFEDSGSK